MSRTIAVSAAHVVSGSPPMQTKRWEVASAPCAPVAEFSTSIDSRASAPCRRVTRESSRIVTFGCRTTRSREVGGEAVGQIRAADQHGHVPSVRREVHHGLPGRVAASDDHDVLASQSGASLVPAP